MLFTRILADTFRLFIAQGKFIKKFLQILSILGIILLLVNIGFFVVDMQIRIFTPYLTILAVVFFCGLIAYKYYIIRILAYI